MLTSGLHRKRTPHPSRRANGLSVVLLSALARASSCSSSRVLIRMMAALIACSAHTEANRGLSSHVQVTGQLPQGRLPLMSEPASMTWVPFQSIYMMPRVSHLGSAANQPSASYCIPGQASDCNAVIFRTAQVKGAADAWRWSPAPELPPMLSEPQIWW